MKTFPRQIRLLRFAIEMPFISDDYLTNIKRHLLSNCCYYRVIKIKIIKVKIIILCIVLGGGGIIYIRE